jgi:hypothetical protein
VNPYQRAAIAMIAAIEARRNIESDLACAIYGVYLDPLEQTQEICVEPEGVFRKVGQLHDEAIFHPAPELSEGIK